MFTARVKTTALAGLKVFVDDASGIQLALVVEIPLSLASIGRVVLHCSPLARIGIADIVLLATLEVSRRQLTASESRLQLMKLNCNNGRPAGKECTSVAPALLLRPPCCLMGCLRHVVARQPHSYARVDQRQKLATCPAFT